MFKKAERKRAKLRLALFGPSGSGKTYSALLVAQGIGSKIALIDTENGSASLYAHLCDFDVCELAPPFTPQKYIDAIHAAERAGYDVIVIDSLTHAWAGQGGLLEQVDARKGRGNDFTAWRDVTPQHNKLVDAMVQSGCHIIATCRTKQEYVLVDEVKNGKTVKAPKKVGMAPVQRDGMEYEFTVVFELDVDRHIASASKDRTSLFDGEYFVPSIETGQRLKSWLDTGKDETAVFRGEAAAIIEELNALTTVTAINIYKRENNLRIRALPQEFLEDVKRAALTREASIAAAQGPDNGMFPDDMPPAMDRQEVTHA